MAAVQGRNWEDVYDFSVKRIKENLSYFHLLPFWYGVSAAQGSQND